MQQGVVRLCNHVKCRWCNLFKVSWKERNRSLVALRHWVHNVVHRYLTGLHGHLVQPTEEQWWRYKNQTCSLPNTEWEQVGWDAISFCFQPCMNSSHSSWKSKFSVRGTSVVYSACSMAMVHYRSGGFLIYLQFATSGTMSGAMSSHVPVWLILIFEAVVTTCPHLNRTIEPQMSVIYCKTETL